MCLAIPGKITKIHQEDGIPMAKANFGGIVKTVCLQYTPQATLGDYILVHVGFALSIVDEAEAERTYQALKDLNELDELDIPEFREEAIRKQKGEMS